MTPSPDPKQALSPADSARHVALEPCPFCGNDQSLVIERIEGTIIHPTYFVRCDYCGAQGPATDHGDHCEEWNRRALRQGGEAWRPTPAEPGWYWHFDGELTRMHYVFVRPGHSYLAIHDEPNAMTGKRHFRMAEKIGGQWQGPLPIPALPTPPAQTEDTP